jgi:cystathionine beta-synthase
VFDKNEIYPYVTEGIGEDFLPQNVDFSLIEHFEKVTDKDAAIMTRRIAREEGIFAATPPARRWPACCMLRDRFTADDVVVVIFHDHGTRYLGKMFNDDWMRKKGYLRQAGLTARDLVASRPSAPLSTLDPHDTVSRAVEVMTANDYSQIPVTDGGRFIGSVNETRLYQAIVKDPEVKTRPIETIMQPAFPFADISMTWTRWPR